MLRTKTLSSIKYITFCPFCYCVSQANGTKWTQATTNVPSSAQNWPCFLFLHLPVTGADKAPSFSKGSVCDSLSQSRFKQLPQPGRVPLSSSYIFTPLGGMCLWLSWVSLWDTHAHSCLCAGTICVITLWICYIDQKGLELGCVLILLMIQFFVLTLSSVSHVICIHLLF